MIEFFSKIADLLSTIIAFAVNTIKSLIQLSLMIPKAFTTIIEVLGLFPPFITVPLIGVLGLALILAIINHFSG